MTFNVDNAITAGLLQADGKWDEMASFCSDWIDQEPNNFLAWQALGDAQQGLLQFTKAIANYRRGLAYAPKKIPAGIDRSLSAASLWHRLGHAYANNSMLPESIYAFQQAVLVDEKWSELWNDLGVTHMRRSEPSDMKYAFDAFRMAATCDPTNMQAMKNLGVLYAMSNRDDGVATMRNMIAKIDPTEADAFDKLARDAKASQRK